jgi:acetyltransferase-like isoleucine patch superfamily enzyme
MLEDNGGKHSNVIPFQCRSLPPTQFLENTIVGKKAAIGAGCKLTGAIVEGMIGHECELWRGAHIMLGAFLGDNCMLGANVLLNTGAIVGSNVRIQQCSAISGTTVVQDNVTIGSCVNFCNAKDGKSRINLLPILVMEGAAIGAGACILGGVTIGAGAIIGAGAVVTKDVPAGETWVGNPAHSIRD